VEARLPVWLGGYRSLWKTTITALVDNLQVPSAHLYTRLVLVLIHVVDVEVSGCTRYDATSACGRQFWTAGQRVDLNRKPSPFAWKQTPGTGSCCGGTCMSEMSYTYWNRGEPNNNGRFDSDLRPISPPLPEKCLQLCRGLNYKWNDGVCGIPACSICEVDI